MKDVTFFSNITFKGASCFHLLAAKVTRSTKAWLTFSDFPAVAGYSFYYFCIIFDGVATYEISEVLVTSVSYYRFIRKAVFNVSIDL